MGINTNQYFSLSLVSQFKIICVLQKVHFRLDLGFAVLQVLRQALNGFNFMLMQAIAFCYARFANAIKGERATTMHRKMNL